jgi:predicted ATPase
MAPLLGRSADLERLEELLATGARVVTIVGIGGAGKTAVATALATRSALPVTFAALADEPPTAALARALDLSVATAADERALDRAVAALGPHLIVLDNAETQIEEVAALVGRWSSSAPDARVLVTSREPLRIEGEARHPLEALSSDAAIELFSRRARAIRPELMLDRQKLAELAARLDHHALSLELAAGRVNVLSVEQILARLDQRLDLLATDRRDALSRQRSLRAAIDASWELLDAADQRAFSSLGVFEGSFSVEAAEAVFKALDASLDALGTLGRLLDKSLVTTADARAEERLSLLESLRLYARERLEISADRDLVHRAHAAFFVARAEASALALRQRGDVSAQRALVRDSANLSAAFERMREADPALAIRAALSLEPPLPFDGPIHLDATRARATADLARALGAPAALAHALIASAMRALGGDGVALAREAAEVAEHHDLLRHGAEASLAEAHALGSQQRIEEGLLAAERAATSFRTLNDHRGEACALLARAVLLTHRGEEPRALCYAAIAAFARAGDEGGEARALATLGQMLAEHESSRHEARELLDRALALSENGHGSATTEARAHLGLATIAMDDDRLDDAEVALTSALAKGRAIGHAAAELAARGSLALLALLRRDASAASREAGLALALARSINNDRMRASLAGFLAVAESSRDHLEAAEASMTEASARAPAATDPGFVLDTVRTLEALVDVARARASRRRMQLSNASEVEARARALLADTTLADHAARWSDLRLARKLLATALEPALASELLIANAPTVDGPPKLTLDAGALWMQRAGIDRVALARRDAVRRILLHLVDRRLASPGAPVPLDELVRAGWPDEKVLPRAAANRVYVALSQLRDLGLRDVLHTHAEGYLLDPTLAIEIREARVDERQKNVAK